MQNVIILYMPGHAGNFVARLFSLTDDTMPLLSQHYLQHCIESGGIPSDFNRLNRYKFSHVPEEFDNWQQFHNSCADFNDWPHYNLLNIFSKEKFSRIVFPLHPHEFIANFSNSDSEFYYVDLDLDQWGSWVDTQQEKLNFYYRDNEHQQFQDLKKKLQHAINQFGSIVRKPKIFFNRI